ncbi:MAG: MaoC family dehydratase [Deltaproteobacteria bacterium]|nr:MaoC family dehydratase [Deltaproteobacteria bacterium]
MPVPYRERYLEDFPVGEVVEFGDYLVTEEEIVSFAKAYDPQSFHTDPVAARTSSFGGLVASGWMTGAILIRLMVDHFIPHTALGSPGVDHVRWGRPVRPDDRLRARATVVEARRSRRRPDRGVVVLRQEALNQRGEIVMSMDATILFRCRRDRGREGHE